jgi:hypothetical protein
MLFKKINIYNRLPVTKSSPTLLKMFSINLKYILFLPKIYQDMGQLLLTTTTLLNIILPKNPIP